MLRTDIVCIGLTEEEVSLNNNKLARLKQSTTVLLHTIVFLEQKHSGCVFAGRDLKTGSSVGGIIKAQEILCFKTLSRALPGVAQWTECWPVD